MKTNLICLLDRLSQESRENEEVLDNRMVLQEAACRPGRGSSVRLDCPALFLWADPDQNRRTDLGISQVQVSRMEKRILKKMREEFGLD